MNRELELIKQVVREYEEEVTEPDDPNDVITFVESLKAFRENLEILDLADAMAGKGEEPFRLQHAEQDIAIVDSWLTAITVAAELRVGEYTVYYVDGSFVITSEKPQSVTTTHNGMHITIHRT